MAISPQDQQAILTTQNGYRSDPAVNTPALQWDSNLATGAQGWADNLASTHQFQHSDPSARQGLGENIAQAKAGSRTAAQLADLWGTEEKPYFKPGIFSNVTTDPSKTVGHYTQMIWRTTTKVGCGLASDGTNDYLVCRYSPQGNMSGVGVPSPQPIRLAQVSCGQAAYPWGVDATGNVYQYQPSDGTGWSQSQVTGRQVKQVSVAADNTVCGLDSQGTIWQYDVNTSAWTQMSGGPLVQISCGASNNIWGVDSSNKVWQFTNSWAQISGSMKQVSVAFDGTVWGLDPQGMIYQYQNNAWTQMPGGPLAQLSCASSGNVWGVGTETGGGSVWQYTTGWARMPGLLKQVSVSYDGTPWGIGTDSYVYRYANNAWTRLVV
jgi:hypothetical protein